MEWEAVKRAPHDAVNKKKVSEGRIVSVIDGTEDRQDEGSA